MAKRKKKSKIKLSAKAIAIIAIIKIFNGEIAEKMSTAFQDT